MTCSLKYNQEGVLQYHNRKMILLALLLLTSVVLQSQKVKKLFRSDSILEIQVTLPIEDVINDLEERNQYESTISYVDEDGQTTVHKVKIHVRGKTRALKQICSFPPLMLNFKKKEIQNSIFKGQNKLKLVAHCQDSKLSQEYVRKEYVVYKMYEIISPYSFKVRLCKITYIDKNNRQEPITYNGFLIESINHLAKRSDMKEYKESLRNQEVLNKDNLDKLVLFQYMIGNLDWSIAERHNIKLMIGGGGGLPLGVPYDFDYAGMVDTPYAVPPEGSDVSNVRMREFRGYCKRDGYDTTIAYYQKIKDELFAVITDAHFLKESSRKNMNKYLETFYRNIDNPKYVDKKINGACKIDHKHAYEYEN